MYHVNFLNYTKQKQIEASIVAHPDHLPNAHSAEIMSFGFKNIISDLYWLRTVQYIGGNVISGEYKKYLSVMMNLITDLNPYFEAPYTIGQLLIPSSEWSYEDTENPENLQDYRDAEALWLKGVKNFCNSEKLSLIAAENDLGNILQNPQYRNPCKGYKIPYYLAYVYYFYLGDTLSASKYYKIVAAQDDAPQGAKVLAAIMQGKGGEREKSLYMFLSLAQNSADSGEACQVLTQELQTAYNYISVQGLPLTGEFIASIESAMNTYLPRLSEKNEGELLSDTQCTNFLAKASRELNLMYLETALDNFQKDEAGTMENLSPESLYQSGYISFLPTDYQQYEEGYGIEYYYNPKTQSFDYQMGY
jgi:hypothetical protein